MSNNLKELIQKVKEKSHEDGATKKQKLAVEMEWMIEQREKRSLCSKCGASYPLTIDHILPKIMLLQLGLDEERHIDSDNLEVLCRACNQLKGDRLDFSNKKTIPLLKKYIALVERRYENNSHS